MLYMIKELSVPVARSSKSDRLSGFPVNTGCTCHAYHCDKMSDDENGNQRGQPRRHSVGIWIFDLLHVSVTKTMTVTQPHPSIEMSNS